MEAGISRHVLEPIRANEEDLMIAVQSDASVLITSQRADERRNCARSIHVEGSRRAGPSRPPLARSGVGAHRWQVLLDAPVAIPRIGLACVRQFTRSR